MLQLCSGLFFKFVVNTILYLNAMYGNYCICNTKRQFIILANKKCLAGESKK